MRIAIKNRDEVERGIALNEPYVMISISCPGDPANIKNVGGFMKHLLRLEFDDLDQPVHLLGGQKCKLFQREDAKDILDFWKRYREQFKFLIVHCDAGISRSPAIAAALTKAEGQLDHEYFKRYYPNRRVYSMILNEFFMNEGPKQN